MRTLILFLLGCVALASVVGPLVGARLRAGADWMPRLPDGRE